MAKKLTLVSVDGKHTVTVDSPSLENHYKWNGYTVAEDQKSASLAPKSGPAEQTPVTAVELPSKGEATPTQAAKGK